MSQSIDVGTVLGGRYKVTSTIVTSREGDLVLDGVDQVLNRPVSILVAGASNSDQLAQSAREVAMGERHGSVQVLDLGISHGSTYLITNHTSPADLLDLIVPQETPYVEPFFTDTLGSEIFGESRSREPETYDGTVDPGRPDNYIRYDEHGDATGSDRARGGAAGAAGGAAAAAAAAARQNRQPNGYPTASSQSAPPNQQGGPQTAASAAAPGGHPAPGSQAAFDRPAPAGAPAGSIPPPPAAPPQSAASGRHPGQAPEPSSHAANGHQPSGASARYGAAGAAAAGAAAAGAAGAARSGSPRVTPWEAPPDATAPEAGPAAAAPTQNQPPAEPRQHWPSQRPAAVMPAAARPSSSAAYEDYEDDESTKPRSMPWLVGGVLAIVLIAALIFAFTTLGGLFQPQAAGTASSTPHASQAQSSAGTAPSPSPSATQSAPTAPPEVESVTRLNPGELTFANAFDSRLPLTFDGNPATYWSDMEFAREDWGGFTKSVALAVKLKDPAQVKQVTLIQSGGSGGNFSIFTSDQPSLTGATLAGTSSFTGPQVVVPVTGSPTASYVIIQINSLPRLSAPKTQYPYGLRLAEIKVE